MTRGINGLGTACSSLWATPPVYQQTELWGNLAKLHDGVPIIIRVTDLTLCREAGRGGQQNTSNDPDCIRFAPPGILKLWQAGQVSSGNTAYQYTKNWRMVVSRKLEGKDQVVERWEMVYHKYKFFWQSCKDSNEGVRVLITRKQIDKVVDVKISEWKYVFESFVQWAVGDLHLCLKQVEVWISLSGSAAQCDRKQTSIGDNCCWWDLNVTLVPMEKVRWSSRWICFGREKWLYKVYKSFFYCSFFIYSNTTHASAS